MSTLENGDTADSSMEALADELAKALIADPSSAASSLRDENISSESKTEDTIQESKDDDQQTKASFFASCVLPLVLDRLKQHVVVASLGEGTMDSVGSPGNVARGLGCVLQIASQVLRRPATGFCRVLRPM